MQRVIDPFELRANPGLAAEVRAEPEQFVERRFRPFEAIEVREAEDGTWTVEGLAAVYNARSENLGGFIEIIMPGAFRKVLAREPDVRALVNHDPNYPLARSTIKEGVGSLRLKEVPEGLNYRATPTVTSYATDLRANLAAGVVTQSSFAFRVARSGVEWGEDDETGLPLRIINEFSGLYDVSPVVYPAYPAATSGVGSRDLAGLDADGLRDLAWKIHRGETDASGEMRAAVDAALAQHDTVSPWVAQRALQAVASEQELAQGAVPGKRAAVSLEDVEGEPDHRIAAMQRRLRLREFEMD